MSKAGDTISITEQDPTYKKTGSWKFNTADAELGSGILWFLIKKHGYEEYIKKKISEQSKIKKEDIDWLSLETNW